jgi:hypothetical protein
MSAVTGNLNGSIKSPPNGANFPSYTLTLPDGTTMGGGQSSIVPQNTGGILTFQ